ncbi:hypothetical protein CYA84_09585 [Campylobacter coli]|nr:hypothetical protein [Campylobacter coli]
MKELTASWLSRRFTDNDFRSVLKNVVLKDGIGKGAKRPNNATNFVDTKTGELIDPTKIREFIKAMNIEVQTRNNFYRGNAAYKNVSQVDNSSILQGSVVSSTPYTAMQVVLESFVGDRITNFGTAIQADFNQVKLNQKSLFLAYGNYFARLEFTASAIANISGGVRLTYNQSQLWYDQGRSNININYDALTKILALKDFSDVEVGIADFSSKKIKWFNNVKLKASTLKFTVSQNTNNPNKTVQKRIVSGYLDFTIDQTIENTISEKLKGALITAARFNKFKQLLNKAEVACLCDCNYCTCDCNYCTCDCNYCTCNCNYCTCDCNYCTCDCNYCTCNNNKEYTDSVKYWNGVVCTCNANIVCQTHGPGYTPVYENKYMTECSCQGDKSVPQYNQYGQIYAYACKCNANWINSVRPHATVTQVCSCNVDKQWTKNITGKPIWDKKSTGQIDNIVNNNTSNSQTSTTVRVCICDTNVTIAAQCSTNRTMSYVDGSTTNQSGYKCVCDINTNRQVTCAANREYKYVTDYTQFQNKKYN